MKDSEICGGDGEANPITSCTPEQEAAILAKIKAEYDPVADEAEFREALRHLEEGPVYSADDILAMIDEMEKNEKPEERREPA
jgi:hypothetical protein